MAPPRQRLGTHDRGGSLRAQLDESVESGSEFRGLHVVGIDAEAQISPVNIGRTSSGWPSPAKTYFVDILYAGVLQQHRQRLKIELRIAARAGELPHIYD